MSVNLACLALALTLTLLYPSLMKTQPFVGLRITLLIVIIANLSFAYIFLVDPERLSAIYGLQVVDPMHQYLAMTVGAFLGVFALGALLAFLLPHKYGTIIVMLLLMHFSIFLIDVTLLARGTLALRILVPELIYFLIISSALVRFYPLPWKGERDIKLEEKKEEPEPPPPVEVGPIS